MRLLLPLLCLACLAAEDPAPAQPPFLGVGVEAVTEFDAPRGLRITNVVPGATFERLGVKQGDLLVSINGTAVTSTDEFRVLAKTFSEGMAMTVVVKRDGADTTLTGTLAATPRPRELAEEGDRLRQEAEALRAQADKAATRSSLEDALRLIKQVEEELPKAAAEFKRVYPNGVFRISIQIDIRSDQDAADAKPLAPTPDAVPAKADPAPTAKPEATAPTPAVKP